MSEPQLVATEAMTVAYARMRGPYAQIPEALGRLYGWIVGHGLQPTGMPATVYHTMPAEVPEADAQWEVQAPVADEVAERTPDEFGVGVKHMASMMAVSAKHIGPYESVGPTYEAMFMWILTNGLVPDGPPMERYYSDPSEVPPEEYVTEIVMPVRRP